MWQLASDLLQQLGLLGALLLGAALILNRGLARRWVLYLSEKAEASIEEQRLKALECRLKRQGLEAKERRSRTKGADKRP